MASQESYSHERPRKRCRVPERYDTSKRSFSDSKYLSSRSELDPILVVVAPLRHRQGEILERNLREAGADILDYDRKNLKLRSDVPSRILIVTDDADKASAHVKSTALEQSIATYISVKWASAVLAARQWIPYENYLLRRDDLHSSMEKTSGSKRIAESESPTGYVSVSGPSSVSPYPVWFSRGVHEGSDISDKAHFMKSLPPYLCQRCTITQSVFRSPNRKLCDLLECIAEKRLLERAGGNKSTADIRARAYRRASSALKCVPFKLKTSKDAESLHSFGPRVLAVANEYLTTGTVVEADMLRSDERLHAMSDFTKLYGVGYSSAQMFFDEYSLKNITQLRDRVREAPEEFSDVLVQYLSYYDDLRRTTRSDAEAFKSLVEDIANDAQEGNLHLRFKLCGGFRRGEASGHDVDLVYCRHAEKVNDHTSVLEELVDRLRRRGLIAAVLRISSDTHGWGEIHYHERTDSIYPYAHDILHGIAQFKGYKFRLDIVGVRDASEFCFAILAWSGSTSFQRDLRLWCENQRRWTFGQHGLFHQESGKRVKLDPFPRSEMDIFDAIGLTYRPPYERSC